MLKKYLECGKIVSTHGVRGEVKVQPWCDSAEYLCEFKNLYLDKSGDKPAKIQSIRVHKGMALLKLEQVSTVEAANALRGTILYINRDDAPDDGKYFVQDLFGITVIDADTGKEYGKIVDVLETGANQVYDLRDENGRQRLVPAIPDVVISSDFEKGTMLIRPLEGLFDED